MQQKIAILRASEFSLKVGVDWCMSHDQCDGCVESNSTAASKHAQGFFYNNVLKILKISRKWLRNLYFDFTPMLITMSAAK